MELGNLFAYWLAVICMHVTCNAHMKSQRQNHRMVGVSVSVSVNVTSHLIGPAEQTATEKEGKCKWRKGIG
jgi:hypothetical protein